MILRNFTSQFDSDNYDLVYKIKSNSVNTLFENHHFIINHDFKNGKVRCNTYSKDLKFMGTDFLKFIDLEVNTDYKSIVEFNRKVEKKENSLIDEGGYTRQELDEMYKAAYENDGQWTWNND